MPFDLKRIIVHVRRADWTLALSGLFAAVRWRGRMSFVALVMALYAWKDPSYIERCIREEYRAERRKALARKLAAIRTNRLDGSP